MTIPTQNLIISAYSVSMDNDGSFHNHTLYNNVFSLIYYLGKFTEQNEHFYHSWVLTAYKGGTYDSAMLATFVSLFKTRVVHNWNRCFSLFRLIWQSVQHSKVYDELLVSPYTFVNLTDFLDVLPLLNECLDSGFRGSQCIFHILDRFGTYQSFQTLS